jgi:hypothetical protein
VRHRTSRRRFLARGLRAAAALPAASLWGAVPAFASPTMPLARRFPDLARHFIFEYYPWYGGPPEYAHWEYLDRRPPHDLSTPYVPRLGAYDVRSLPVLEQHARWIADAGVGAVALSWWGRGTFQDLAVARIMDVLHAHGLKATFALEPYADDRGSRFASDIIYLLREYGERRGWDAFLILRQEDGREGPVFKGFRTILPERTTDCHGVTRPVSDYTPDTVWRAQIDRLRHELRHDFDHVTLLADSLDMGRTRASGFDGIGIYDNFIPPADYTRYATGASATGLLFSFNVNPGFHAIEPRVVEPGSCYQPQAFAPPGEPIDWSRAEGRERAAERSEQRIVESFQTALGLQTDPLLNNAKRGFFLVYINSFNEWHEGHAFEPMKDAAALTAEERAHGYHNPERGTYRLEALAQLMRDAASRPAPPRPGSNPAQV